MLQQAFDDGARPPPLAVLAQVLPQSIASHEIRVPVANLSDPTSETALGYLLAIVDYGSVREELPGPQIPNSWHTSLRRTAATALDTLWHRIASAGPLLSLAEATAHPPATDRTDPRHNPLDQQQWAFDGSHCAGISAERVTTHVWLETFLNKLNIWNPDHLDRIGQNGTFVSEHGTDMYVHVQTVSDMYVHVQTVS